MMKKNFFRSFLTVTVLFISALAWADDYAFLNVVDNNNEQKFAVSNIQKITFADGNMVVTLADGTAQTLPLLSLTRMFFTEGNTDGISTISGEKAADFSLRNGLLNVKTQEGAQVTVYDMNGKTVKTVKATGRETEIDVTGLGKGNYIIKVGNTTRKMMNK